MRWVLALLAGCGPASTPGSCPNDLPDACPDPAPTFSGDVEPVFDRVCRTCHAPGGEAASVPLDTFDAIAARRGAVLDQVYACLMPPPTSGLSLDDAERAALLGWLVCGAPDD